MSQSTGCVPGNSQTGQLEGPAKESGLEPEGPLGSLKEENNRITALERRS